MQTDRLIENLHPYDVLSLQKDESCVSCGICAEGCPVGAIPMDRPNCTDNDLCINCLRCVQICPVQCRTLPTPFLDFVTSLLKENATGYKKPAIFL